MHCKDGSLTDLYCKTAPPLASSTHLPSDVFMAFDAFALILAMLALGMLFARFDVLPASSAEVLNRVVLLVCLPAAVLVHVPSLRFDPALIGLAATPWLLAAATVLLVSLTIQSVAMLAWLGLADRAALHGIVRHWRASLWAGALGAFASLFWFMGFALTAAANVRTLALVEVVMAQLVSGRVFREGAAPRQILGMGLIVAGVALLIAVSG